MTSLAKLERVLSLKFVVVLVIVALVISACSINDASADSVDSDDLIVVYNGSIVEGNGSALYPEVMPSLWSGFSVSVMPHEETVFVPISDDSFRITVWKPEFSPVAVPAEFSPLAVYAVSIRKAAKFEKIAVSFPNVANYEIDSEHLVYAYNRSQYEWMPVGVAVVTSEGETLSMSQSINDDLVYNLHFIDPEAL